MAIKMDGMIRDGTVRDYADLARLGHVSRTRITQIMGLLNLAQGHTGRNSQPAQNGQGA